MAWASARWTSAPPGHEAQEGLTKRGLCRATFRQTLLARRPRREVLHPKDVGEHWLSVEQVAQGVLVFELAGESDLTGDRIRRELEDALGTGVAAIVVDCSGLEFLETWTIDALLSAASALGERLAVVAPQGDVRSVLELTGLESMLNVHETRAAALHGLGVGQVDECPSGT
jgi:anti-anti-sigma factor